MISIDDKSMQEFFYNYSKKYVDFSAMKCNFLSKKLCFKEFDIYIFRQNNIDEYVILDVYFDRLDSVNDSFFSRYISNYIISCAMSMRFYGYSNIAIFVIKNVMDSISFSQILKKENIIESNIRYSINNNICYIKDRKFKTLKNNEITHRMKNFANIKNIDIMLRKRGIVLEGKYCVIIGIDENSIHLLKALCILKASVIAISDNSGFIYDCNGLNISLLLDIINDFNGLFKENNFLQMYAKMRDNAKTCVYSRDRRKIFDIPAFAFFLNDSSMNIGLDSAKSMIKNGCKCIIEYLPMISYKDDFIDIESKKDIDYKIKLDSKNTLTSIFELNKDSNISNSALEYIIESRIVFVPFMLNFMRNLLPSLENTNYKEMVINLNEIYRKAFDMANKLKYPTNLLLGIISSIFLEQGEKFAN